MWRTSGHMDDENQIPIRQLCTGSPHGGVLFGVRLGMAGFLCLEQVNHPVTMTDCAPGWHERWELVRFRKQQMYCPIEIEVLVPNIIHPWMRRPRHSRQSTLPSSTIRCCKRSSNGRMAKGRKGRRKTTGSDEEREVSEARQPGEAGSVTIGNNSKPSIKDMDFAQRRALQRQQAAEKRRSKQKCYLCVRAGHVRRECPGIPDDGRGMSHYKGKSDKASEKQKLMERRKQRGSSGNHDAALMDLLPDYPEAFTRPENNAASTYGDGLRTDNDNDGCPIYFDVHCNIPASIEYLRHGRGETKKAVEILVTTIHEHYHQIVAVGATLDYSPQTIAEPGMDQQSQVCRLQTCWKAAAQARVPLQLHISPGAASLDPEQDSVAGTDYAKVLLDAQAQLTEATNLYPDLAVHIVGWCGKAAHMVALLKAFPSNIRAVGLDPSVGFAKATDLHECAFDVPLDRLVLETSTTIPVQVNDRMGRAAFFQSGWWPFVAQSVADHKKVMPIREIIRASNENALALYPQLLKAASVNGSIEE
eukprot:scaffold3667_cov180-Amphora_coffeaeformis.AAC.15